MKRLLALAASALLVCALTLSSAKADGGTTMPGAQPTPTPCPEKQACPEDGSGSPTTAEETEPNLFDWLLSFIGF
jgi:hypothetical protein